jgi:hypothetical protein
MVPIPNVSACLLALGLLTARPQMPAGTQAPTSRPASRPSEPAKEVTKDPVIRPADQGGAPAPAGATPEDIRAMRGAKAMLQAEARLKALIKDGKIKGIDRVLTFEEISSWPYEDGLKGMPESVKKLDGLKVMMTGFMLPIDEVENIKQFLLVQSLWSCCFGQPPDINGLVRVVMQGGQKVQYQYDPLKVIGTFVIKPHYDDDYCVDVFTLKAESVEVIN